MGEVAAVEEAVLEREKRPLWLNITRTVFVKELKKAGSIAAPMVAVTVLQYLLQVVSVIIVGHLSQRSLSSVAIAVALTNVSGFSVLVT